MTKISAHDTRSLVHFHRNSNTTFRLSNSFIYNTYVVFLDMITVDVEDPFYIK